MQLPLAKNINRYFSLKRILIYVVSTLILFALATGIYFSMRISVSIYYDGNTITLKTMKTTLHDVLIQAGLNVSSNDYVSVPLDSKLQRKNDNKIYIKFAVPVFITVDEQKITRMTYNETVGDVLRTQGISLFEGDLLAGNLTLEDKVSNNMEIRIIRVKQEIDIEQISIPFGMDKVANSELDSGTERVVRDGKEGIQEKLYKVVIEDGIEIARNLLRDVVVSNPVNALVEYGTAMVYRPARGDSFRYKSVLEMKATAYTALGSSPVDSPYFGYTASGMKAQRGVIAVDPRIIPLGTRVYVEVAGNTLDYGFAIAADTGGAIKGDIIDVYFDTWEEAMSFGLKRVKVYILSN